MDEKFADREKTEELACLFENCAASTIGHTLTIDRETLDANVEGTVYRFATTITRLLHIDRAHWPANVRVKLLELALGLQQARFFINEISWQEAKDCLRVRIQKSLPSRGFEVALTPQIDLVLTAEYGETIIRITTAMAQRWRTSPTQLWEAGLRGNEHSLKVTTIMINFGTFYALAFSGGPCTTGKVTSLHQDFLDFDKAAVLAFPTSNLMLYYPDFELASIDAKQQHQNLLQKWYKASPNRLSPQYFLRLGPLDLQSLPFPYEPQNHTPEKK